MAGGAVDSGYVDNINTVPLSVVLSSCSVLESCGSISCGYLCALRIMELDPVSAIGFSPIQSIVGQFDKLIDGRRVLQRKTCNPPAYGESKLGKRSAESGAL